MTTSGPLPNLLGFIADEDKEFQASLARDRAEITLWDRIQVFSNQRFVVGSPTGRGDEMVKQKLVTLTVPSLVLDEFRRLGRIYPWRLIVI